MNPKRLYLALAVVGAVAPWYFFLSFLMEGGPGIAAALDQLWATNMTRFFTVDVLLTGLALLVYLLIRERMNGGRFWLLAGATVLVGPSCSLPLLLYFKERDKTLPMTP